MVHGEVLDESCMHLIGICLEVESWHFVFAAITLLAAQRWCFGVVLQDAIQAWFGKVMRCCTAVTTHWCVCTGDVGPV